MCGSNILSQLHKPRKLTSHMWSILVVLATNSFDLHNTLRPYLIMPSYSRLLIFALAALVYTRRGRSNYKGGHGGKNSKVYDSHDLLHKGSRT